MTLFHLTAAHCDFFSYWKIHNVAKTKNVQLILNSINQFKTYIVSILLMSRNRPIVIQETWTRTIQQFLKHNYFDQTSLDSLLLKVAKHFFVFHHRVKMSRLYHLKKHVKKCQVWKARKNCSLSNSWIWICSKSDWPLFF